MTILTTSNGIRFLIHNDKQANFLKKTINYADQLRANRDKKNETRKMAYFLKVRERYERQVAGEEAALAQPTVDAEPEGEIDFDIQEEVAEKISIEDLVEENDKN